MINLIIDDTTSSRMDSSGAFVITEHKVVINKLVNLGVFLIDERKRNIYDLSNEELGRFKGSLNSIIMEAYFSSSEDLSEEQLKSVLALIETYTSLKENVQSKKPFQLPLELQNAAYRVAANQLNRATSQAMTLAMPAGMPQEFISSELGRSFVALVSGVALSYATKEPGKVDRLARELRIAGMTSAANFAIEEVLAMVADVARIALIDEKPVEEEILITVEEETKSEKKV